MKKFVFPLLACLAVLNATAQTYAERLGFPAGKKSSSSTWTTPG